ncbi:MAG: SH3 domain-containing protein [Anaerolineae bacterium]|nr:SH3 domain-containing protein [Anaerolineae bacterium]
MPFIPAGALTATVIRASVLNVRDAPSTGGNRLGRILRGETYAVLGRDADARWFLLQLGGYQGWAYGYYLFVNGNEFNAPVTSPFGTLGVPAGVVDTGVVAQSRATLVLRDVPSVAGNQIGRVTWGAFLPVVGRTGDGFWYQVVWKGTVGWVYSPYTELTQGDLNAVPVR